MFSKAAYTPFRPSYDRSCKMAGCSRLTATGQNEFLQWWQIFVETVKVLLQSCDVRGLHCLVPGYAQLATEFEKIVLDVRETAANSIGHSSKTEYDADGAICLVNSAVGLHARVVLAHPIAAEQAGGAVVAGSGVELHGNSVTEAPGRRSYVVGVVEGIV